MHIHWDSESDSLEVRFGKAKPSYYEDLGNDIFERRDEKTNQLTGYIFFNVIKRNDTIHQDIEVDMPIETYVSS